MGDLNGDGYIDLAVGAPGHEAASAACTSCGATRRRLRSQLIRRPPVTVAVVVAAAAAVAAAGRGRLLRWGRRRRPGGSNPGTDVRSLAKRTLTLPAEQAEGQGLHAVATLLGKRARLEAKRTCQAKQKVAILRLDPNAAVGPRSMSR